MKELLECASSVEIMLGLPPADTKWVLSTDSTMVLEDFDVARQLSDGKLFNLGLRHEPVHIDRSPLDIALPGFLPTWAEWMVFGFAHVAILSASGFGVTAAEVGGI